jgi:hypothetical protein
MYRPYVVFAGLGLILLLAGITPFARYLVLMLVDDQGNHLQSLLVGATLLMGSLLSFAIGVVADLTRINRTLNEEMLDYLKLQRYGD